MSVLLLLLLLLLLVLLLLLLLLLLVLLLVLVLILSGERCDICEWGSNVLCGLFWLFIIIVIIVKPDICRYCTEHVNETYLINVVFVCFVCFSRVYESV